MHSAPRRQCPGAFLGTADFCSRAHLVSRPLGYRDDIESLAYCFLCMLDGWFSPTLWAQSTCPGFTSSATLLLSCTGGYPWSITDGVDCTNGYTYRDLIRMADIKDGIMLSLVGERSMPLPIAQWLRRSRAMRLGEVPEYAALRQLLEGARWDEMAPSDFRLEGQTGACARAGRIPPPDLSAFRFVGFYSSEKDEARSQQQEEEPGLLHEQETAATQEPSEALPPQQQGPSQSLVEDPLPLHSLGQPSELLLPLRISPPQLGLRTVAPDTAARSNGTELLDEQPLLWHRTGPGSTAGYDGGTTWGARAARNGLPVTGSGFESLPRAQPAGVCHDLDLFHSLLGGSFLDMGTPGAVTSPMSALRKRPLGESNEHNQIVLSLPPVKVSSPSRFAILSSRTSSDHRTAEISRFQGTTLRQRQRHAQIPSARSPRVSSSCSSLRSRIRTGR